MLKNIETSVIAFKAIKKVNSKNSWKFLWPEVITELTAEKIAKIWNMEFWDENDDWYLTQIELKEVKTKNNIEQIYDFNSLKNFVIQFEWENTEKLNVKYFTQFIIKMKTEFKYLDLFSKQTTLTKLFWINFLSKIKSNEESTYLKYLEHDEDCDIERFYSNVWIFLNHPQKSFNPDNRI